jgi:hypothetical protein
METKWKPAASGSGGHREVQIRDFKSLNKNTLRAVFTASLRSGMTVHGLMLHEREGRRWISLPSKEYVAKNGERSYTPIIEIPDRADFKRFQAEILAAVDHHLSREPVPPEKG